MFSTRDFSTTLLRTSGGVPSPRHAHGAALICTTLLICGGKAGGKNQNEHEPTPGNVLRPSHSLSTLVIMFCRFGGGGDQHCYNDTWSFDISTRKWTELQCTGFIPSPRVRHAAVLVDDVMYVFGEFSTDEGYLDGLYALQLTSECLSMLNRYLVHVQNAARRWFKIHNVGPSPHRRWDHAMASVGTRVFVLGGYSNDAREDEISLIHVFDTSMSVCFVISSGRPPC